MTSFAEKTKSLFASVDIGGSFKAFILVFIIAVIIMILYVLVKPDHSIPLGITAFPTNGPYIPTDSSDCGLKVITGDQNTDCSAICKSNNYQLTHIPKGKQVYYLGTKLQDGKYYCLPFQNSTDNDNFRGCGTYTGRAIWTIHQMVKNGLVNVYIRRYLMGVIVRIKMLVILMVK